MQKQFKYIIPVGIILLLLKPKKMSAATVIARHEGLRLNAYQDSGGIWTIGYGSIYNHDAKRPVRQGDRITRAKAIEWLQKDTKSAESAVKRLVKVPLTANQRIALTSLVYNIGSGAFARSTILRMLNSKTPKNQVAMQFLRWVNVQGQPVQGLINRRRDEMQLFLS